MPRNARFVLTGQPYHVTQRGNNRQPVFFSPEDRQTYLDLVRDNLADAGVRVYAYCLMTNHVHWVIVPERGDSLAVLFRRVHGRYAQYLNIRRRCSGHLWQARFFSCVLSSAHLDVALRYVERNPVRALMTEAAESYLWSSAAVHSASEPIDDGLLDLSIWHNVGGTMAWRGMLAHHDPMPLVHMLRRCTFGERPFGDEQFLQSVEAQTGRSWKRYNFDAELRAGGLALSLESLRVGLATSSSHAGEQLNAMAPEGSHHAHDSPKPRL